MVAQLFRGVRTAPLDRETRSFMERGLGEDFRTVRVAVRRGRGGPIACTFGEHIVFAAGCYRPDTLPGRLVLAHELAHVVQKRRGAKYPSFPPVSARALEVEAHAAAVAIACGGRFRCALPDCFEVPRFWEEEGHYYTSYMIMLAAGIDPKVAYQMATFSQIPDEIEELDASGWGKKVKNLDGLIFGGNRRGIPEPLATHLKERDELELKLRLATMSIDPYGVSVPPADLWLTREDIKRLDWLNKQLDKGLQEYMLDIQIGLHCLSGRNSIEETTVRAHRLLKAELGSIEFGLGIHAYGDSFAHRQLDGGVMMYAPGFGHGIEVKHLKNPYSPDYVQTRPELYAKYGLGFYHILCKTAPGDQRRMDRDTLGSKLLELAKINDKEGQRQRIRQITAEMGTPLAGDKPEDNGDNLYVWETYQWHFTVSPTFLADTLKIAKEWRLVQPHELQGTDQESVDPALPEAYVREKAEQAELVRKATERRALEAEFRTRSGSF